jgi:hypothetical protein
VPKPFVKPGGIAITVEPDEVHYATAQTAPVHAPRDGAIRPGHGSGPEDRPRQAVRQWRLLRWLQHVETAHLLFKVRSMKKFACISSHCPTPGQP